MDSEQTIKALSDLLKNFSKSEIIDTINRINEKIGSMYSISTSDFGKFGILLKDYHSSIKLLLDWSNKAQEYAFGMGQSSTQQLRTIYNERKSTFSYLVTMSHKLSDAFVLVQTLVDRAVVPFNNLRQNVITIQYLLANIRLGLVCDPLRTDKNVFKSIENLEHFIAEYRKQIDNANCELESIIQRVSEMKHQDDLHYLISVMPAENYIASSSRELKEFSVEGYFNMELFNLLHRHIQSCFSDLNEVVTNLQYHDIIRQKIEHISEAQQMVIKRLDGIDNAQNEKELVEAQVQLLARLPEVFDVQVAQLMYINNDYQDSIDKITTMLIDVGHELKQITTFFEKVSEGTRKILDDILPELRNRQIRYIELVDCNEHHIEGVMNEFADLIQRYDRSKQIFSSIFQSERELRNLIDDLDTQLNNRSHKLNAENVGRMRSVSADIKVNSNLMKTCFNKVTDHLQLLNGIQKEMVVSNKSASSEAEMMEVLKRDIMKFRLESMENCDKCCTLSNEIVAATKKVEYYNYFKKTVDEIVEMLNDMNKNSCLSKLKSDINEGGSELLEYIQNLYTMKSERDVYDNVLNGKPEYKRDNDIDDIEFF